MSLSPAPDQQPQSPPFAPRRMLVLALSVLIGLVAGGLSLAAHASWPEAILVAGGTFGGTARLLNQFLGQSR